MRDLGLVLHDEPHAAVLPKGLVQRAAGPCPIESKCGPARMKMAQKDIGAIRVAVHIVAATDRKSSGVS